ncbi:hypothetical protein FRC07_010532 [Ceratobasidium sp. 392]|nr:hypothetical protein FRC07_010532 [Ceratobasidium sp. 392]
MRFFYTALAASLAVAVSGIAIDTSKLTLADVEDVTEILIEEQCRGAVKWSEEGFFRSGSTENPETSDIWRDLGECDPDAQPEGQKSLGKRSSSNLQALDDDDEDTVCTGGVEWEVGAFYRSGTTVHYGDHLWQTWKWVKAVKGEEPGNAKWWTVVATCSTPKPKLLAKRDGCAGVRNFVEEALYRSGTTVEYNDKKYQALKWVKGEAITNEKYWKLLGDC